MTPDVYFQFFQTPAQLRLVGARGGRATARRRRTRLSTVTPRPLRPLSEAPWGSDEETVAAAIAVLDAQFPWLRGAEKRLSHTVGVPG